MSREESSSMHAIAPDTVLNQLRWRYATKKFDPTRKIPAEVWSKLEQAVVLAPSSYGLQPWKFIVVTNPEIRKQLQPASYNQPQIVDASHLVVFAAKNPPTPADVERHIGRTAQVRGLKPEVLEDYKKRMLGSLSHMTEADAFAWATRQCYIALGVFLSSAALLEVDACPMEGFQNAQYDEILGLKAKGLGSVVIATAGYRAADDPAAALAKSRFDVNDVIERI
jgi:nitroreductase